MGDFCAITGATPQVARHFLTITDGDPSQAIQLFFDSPDLASAATENSSQPPSVPASSRPTTTTTTAGREDEHGVVHIDSDDDMDLDAGDDRDTHPATASAESRQNMNLEDDEALARRLQEEMYAGGDMSGGLAPDDVRAPISRTTETLIGPSSNWGPEDTEGAVLEQLRRRAQPRSRGGLGVFNQHAPSSSIWESSDPAARRQGLAAATGGASETSSKAARLAELFRPPFELMSRLSWDEARDEGKESEKWIIVNIQDPAVFDCQALNRDIWKHEGIKETVQENFIFMQYSKDDPAAQQYMQYYFQHHEDQNAYPHIAIVDPRTGEQVKVWSGPPAPKAMDFLMQLHEFLDRYSLDPTFRNPVARRKADKPVALDVDRLSEEQMLELALQNSLSNGAGGAIKREDPDELTKSVGDLHKGKANEVSGAEIEEGGMDDTNGHSSSAFAAIASDKPHSEPANDPKTTTRIQFKHSGGRIVRRFSISDPVRRFYEWLKAEPIDGKAGVEFELKKTMGGSGSDMIDDLDQTIDEAGLRNGTVMVEFLED